MRSKDGEGEPFFRLYFIDRMSLAEVCALLTVIIGLLTLMVTVAKAAFDAGRKISNKEHDKKKIPSQVKGFLIFCIIGSRRV